MGGSGLPGHLGHLAPLAPLAPLVYHSDPDNRSGFNPRPPPPPQVKQVWHELTMTKTTRQDARVGGSRFPAQRNGVS